MAELKPCPFCGEPVSMVYNSFDKAFKVYHRGNKWCAVIEPIMIEGLSLADAAEKWNRRDDDAF